MGSLQVTNQMLSITGSLLADPSNPPPPPAPPAVTVQQELRDSPTPEPAMGTPARPIKKARTVREPAAESHVKAGPAPKAAQQAEIDESLLTARELKQKRKEEARQKRDAKKASKADKDLLDVQAVDGPLAMVLTGQEDTREGTGKKRKGGDEEGGKKKKRK
jgi:DNA-directed RNA polymerase I subunit RPA43